MNENLEASFSVLLMSIASTAAMAMGLSPNEQGQFEKDKNMARFNIDLLVVLQNKTKGNLSSDEAKFLENLINDLQMKFVSI